MQKLEEFKGSGLNLPDNIREMNTPSHPFQYIIDLGVKSRLKQRGTDKQVVSTNERLGRIFPKAGR